MDISKLPPPNDPKAEIIRKDREFFNRSSTFTAEEILYNVAVCEARTARGETPPAAPKASTPLRDSFTKIFEILQ